MISVKSLLELIKSFELRERDKDGSWSFCRKLLISGSDIGCVDVSYFKLYSRIVYSVSPGGGNI